MQGMGDDAENIFLLEISGQIENIIPDILDNIIGNFMGIALEKD